MSLTKRITRNSSRAKELENALKSQFNMYHLIEHYDDYEIEKLLLRQKEREVELIKKPFEVPEGYVKFSPSGADKCERELFYKIMKAEKDELQKYPYQKRWTRNSSAVHEAVQRDLLYMEKFLPNPAFTVERMEDGLPAWEQNIQRYKIFKHNGVEFILYGMMDGVLKYTKDGSRIGFEFKTKSTKADAVEKLKKASTSHKLQCVAYSLLFDIDEYLITYESVAKDEWRIGAGAMDDIKPFYVKVTEEQKQQLLDKLARVTEMVQNGELPERDTSKCMFCPYKTICLGGM
jgi:CRISPR/Cas system-associated exonuclease Cas4 (RecB family)